MKYIKKFNQHLLYENYKSGNEFPETMDNYVVSLCEEHNKINYDKYVKQYDYIEIGGIKWATMNLGASSVTDTGLFFSWADTQGYTKEQGLNGEKSFLQANYKYYDAEYYHENYGYTKYNSEDGLLVLDPSDDAATVIMGSNWKTPSLDDFQILVNSCNITVTNNYQDSNVSGVIFTDKTDSSKVLFMPFVGSFSYYDNDYMHDDYVWLWTANEGSFCGPGYASVFVVHDDGYPVFSDACDRAEGLAIRPICVA